MSPSTAIILHPSIAVHEPANSNPRLETTGPDGDGYLKIHLRPGHFLPCATFPEFLAYRERYCNVRETRRPIERAGWEIEALAARRIVNLIDRQGGFLFSHQIAEIRWRTIIAQPFCMSEDLEDTHL